MGCDIHILIQIFDPISNTWIFVKETSGDNLQHIRHEGLTLTIFSQSSGKLDCITSEELEYKRKAHEKCDDEECDCYSDFYVWFHVRRDYHLFKKIAGIRDYGEEMTVIPKGLPSDADDALKNMLIDGEGIYKSMHPADLHSHTYLSDAEIEEFQFEDNGGLEELKTLLRRVQRDFPDKQSRFVIAFDN